MPTLVIIHGGSANWYEFFVDLFNNPGLGQYLALKISVVPVTIPGNHKDGGWTEPAYEKRVAPYVLDREIPPLEAEVRNAIFTFRVCTEEIRQLIETTTTGPVVVVGHSTAGEFPNLFDEYEPEGANARVILRVGQREAGRTESRRRRRVLEKDCRSLRRLPQGFRAAGPQHG